MSVTYVQYKADSDTYSVQTINSLQSAVTTLGLPNTKYQRRKKRAYVYLF